MSLLNWQKSTSIVWTTLGLAQVWIFFCSFIPNLSNPSMVGRKGLRTSRSLLLLLLLSALLLSQQIHISLRLLFWEISFQIHYFTLMSFFIVFFLPPIPLEHKHQLDISLIDGIVFHSAVWSMFLVIAFYTIYKTAPRVWVEHVYTYSFFPVHTSCYSYKSWVDTWSHTRSSLTLQK